MADLTISTFLGVLLMGTMACSSPSVGSAAGGSVSTGGAAKQLGGSSSTQGGSATAGGNPGTVITSGGNGGAAGGNSGVGGSTLGKLRPCGCASGDLGCDIRCAAMGTTNTGDCVGSCPNNAPCVSLSPGGYRVCTSTVAQANTCNASHVIADECCATSDCTTGICLESPSLPYCGGAAPIVHNVCATNECQSSKDCMAQPMGVCMPAGGYGYKVATCLYGGCQADTDCTAEPKGACQPIQSPCCSAVTLQCVYPSGCISNANCGPSAPYCRVNAGRTECSTQLTPCPP